jgi:DNA repair protein RecO (recombination protein O)
MLINTTGIILRSVKYSETSLILDIFTRDFGLKTYIVSGARKKNSTSGAALFQISNVVEIVAYNKENSKINRIKEAKISRFFNRLSLEINRFSIALFILEVLSKTLKEKEANFGLYDFLENSLEFIDQCSGKTNNIHLAVLCKMTRYMGFFPENNFSAEYPFFDLREGKFIEQNPFHNDYLDENISLLFSTLINTDIENSDKLQYNKTTRQQILDKLILYYKIHLTDFGRIKTLEVFKNIFSSA